MRQISIITYELHCCCLFVPVLKQFVESWSSNSLIGRVRNNMTVLYFIAELLLPRFPHLWCRAKAFARALVWSRNPLCVEKVPDDWFNDCVRTTMIGFFAATHVYSFSRLAALSLLPEKYFAQWQLSPLAWLRWKASRFKPMLAKFASTLNW